jgi:hypothetical protein
MVADAPRFAPVKVYPSLAYYRETPVAFHRFLSAEFNHTREQA